MTRILAAAFLMVGMTASGARAADVVEEWANIKPPAPALKPVTVDPKTTALLMLDFMKQNYGQRPRCVASLPAMKKLLADARAAKTTVIYSIIANSKIEDVLPKLRLRMVSRQCCPGRTNSATPTSRRSSRIKAFRQ